jgi:signal transduction histidine kinase
MWAAEQERRRWARELHDDTLQDIGALRVLLGSARQGADPEHLAAAVDHAVERLAEQANVLRSLITDLHPAALDRLGIGPAVDALIERAREQSGLDISVSIDLAYESGREERRLAPETELAVYRVVQEALTNVMRHAEATRVEIVIAEEDGRVTARVSDDGTGFETDTDAAGFGLVGMRERASLLDGQVTVASRVGAGTTVTVTLPVERASAEPPALGRTG